MNCRVAGLPYFCVGKVVTGFGRGSKQLGIPTANFPQDVVDKLPPEVGTGVYFGFARVGNGPVYKMVMSIGWNPFFENKQKSMETHIMHKFEEDFYGQTLSVGILGYLREEMNFDSLDALIKQIKDDIDRAERILETEEFSSFKNHDFFTSSTET